MRMTRVLDGARVSAVVAAAFAVASLAGTPAADAADGFYVGGGLGMNFARDSGLDSATFQRNAEFDNGLGLMGIVGYGFGNAFRAELELGWRSDSVDNVSGVGAIGDFSTWSLMLNGIYDIPISGPVRPFIGAGVGYAWVKADNVSPVATTAIDDSDGNFAWQGIAGVAVPLNDRLTFDLSYRYFNVPDVSFGAANGAGVDSEYEAHTVMAVLRFALNAPAKPMMAQEAPRPAPAPAPAPAVQPAPRPSPAVARSYLVFFDWDSAQLTADARNILASAAAAVKQTGTTRIVATGHADRSGPSPYNQRLSQRRANAVKAELVRQGIAANDISVVARGESEPLVETADGVREPRNRRVQIVLQ